MLNAEINLKMLNKERIDFYEIHKKHLRFTF